MNLFDFSKIADLIRNSKLFPSAFHCGGNVGIVEEIRALPCGDISHD